MNGTNVQDAESWKVMGILSWDIWESGKTYFSVKAAESKILQAKQLENEILKNIELEVKNAYLRWEEAKKNVPVAELSVHQAEEGFRIAEERYKEHITTSTEVLDAQTLLTQAKTNYYTALYNCNIALAKLYGAIGMCNNME